MKNPVEGTVQKGGAEEREQKAAIAGVPENQLGPKTRETELRLGFSSNGLEEVRVGQENSLSLLLQVHSSEERMACGDGALVLNQMNCDIGAKRWFSEAGDGFGKGWMEERSLFYQSSRPGEDDSSTIPRVLPIVGWPPVRSTRKNVALQSKPKEETKVNPISPKPTEISEDSMFVKVNMVGYAVGRKVDLKAHDSYESLFVALQKMYDDFFAINCFKNKEVNDGGSTGIPDHVLIYEDNEGDRMLVGDVPWEMFINSVKRLYISVARATPGLSIVKRQQ